MNIISDFYFKWFYRIFMNYNINYCLQKSAIGNNTVGYNILISHDIPVDDYWYWAGAGILILYAVFFHSMVTLSLAYLNRKF